MRLLLTSAGIKNPSIHDALVDLLGKPIAESSALCISTSSYGHPMAGPGAAWQFISGNEPAPHGRTGVEVHGRAGTHRAAQPRQERWVSWVQETDVLLVNGGDPLYLCYWMRESGLADLLPSLNAVWVGLSAGSMIMTPRIGDWFIEWTPPTGRDDTTLGLVDFSIFPHLAHPDLPHNTMANAERWAASLSNPAYAIDDETAIKVVDGVVEVVSEGEWRLFSS